ncbi:hypothetical protein [Nocardia asiatica]|uniref:hypothetical protein n=1 Tax=Nocardia asiatica TaxID=209252 RepID=UPI000687E6BF|nr:hypothetical protein [Nocardia asiatica]
MKPLRLPADPAKVAKNYLASVIPGMVAAPAPTFGMVVPTNWTPSSAPHLVVFDDSGPTRWPVMTRPLLRVTVWADGRDRSRAIAGAALGVLLSHSIPGIATVTEPSLLLEARDSTNGGVLASFTVRAQARTLPA